MRILEIVGWAGLPEHVRIWEGWIVWSLGHFSYWLPIALGLGLILWGNWGAISMRIKSQIARYAFAAFLIVVAFIIPPVPSESEEHVAPVTPPLLLRYAQSAPAITNNQGIVTFGQTGGTNTVFNGDRLARVTDETVAQIKEHLPLHAKVVIIKMMNDGPSAQMEETFHKILIDNGYEVVGSGIGLGGYFKGFAISPKPDANGIYTLTIGDPRG